MLSNNVIYWPESKGVVGWESPTQPEIHFWMKMFCSRLSRTLWKHRGIPTLEIENSIFKPSQWSQKPETKERFGPISTRRQGWVCFPQSHPKLPAAPPDPAATTWPSFPFLLHHLYFHNCTKFLKLQWDIFAFQVLQQKSKPPKARSGHSTGFKQD